MNFHNTRQLKKLNTEQVRAALRACGTATKAWISHLTSLSIATCGTILDEMVATGEAFESESAPSDGGRPARRFTYNPDFQLIFALVIEHSGPRLRCLSRVVNAVGDVKEERSGAPEGAITYELLRAMAEQAAHRYPAIRAVGIGLPCVVQNGVVEGGVLPALENLPLGKKLAEDLGLEVLVDNDMLFTTYGFYARQEGNCGDTVAVLYFPKNSCPGSGAVVDGQLLRGATNFAGEVSFLPVGLTCSEQTALFSGGDRAKQTQVIARMAECVIALLNPSTLAVCGDAIQPEMLGEVRALCAGQIPEKHLPRIEYLDDVESCYLSGVVSITMESLRYRLQSDPAKSEYRRFL